MITIHIIFLNALGSLSYKSKRISCSFFGDLVDLEIDLF